ncbi:dipeptidase [Aeromicrobium tamlense]|uniref:Microsomal dipeptidase-like Zn-dependent dipeptidase n=1 Tax=Aeromicrobium tamlense TaxID=375541 RepID=A0ABX2SMZ2_9ACTN|nr:membrane dipeptidase [Aeromicrobium tamlense]NYI39340.1 microsomal dipeptidase-like Zn-dependent dipeptidase [Aeromicrobium tamlense]
MAKKTRTWLRRTLLAVLVLLLLGVVGFFALGPGIVENSMNRMADTDLAEPDRETVALHDSLFIADLHSDTLMWNRDLLDRSDRGHMDLPRLQDGNVGLQVFSSVSKTPKNQNYDSNPADTDNITLLAILQLQPPRTWTSLVERSLYHAEKLQDAVADSEGELRFIRSRDDLDRLVADREAGKNVTGALFSLEGLQSLEGDLDNLGRLFGAGARMAGFTHFFDNEVSGSMHGEGKGGLTDLGREAFAEMERRGMVVDIAHASHPAIAEMLELATKPVVASHGGVQATCDVNRNLTDDEIRGVAATGGVVGIGYWDAAVCELTPAAVVDAIEHVIEVGGLETAALGSDYDGATKVAWDTSDIAVVTQELRDRGHSDEDIAAIMGGNTLRVLRAVLPVGSDG